MKYHRKATLIFLFLGSFILIVKGIAWLSIGLLATALLFWMAVSDNITIARLRKIGWITFSFYILAIILFSIGIRIFIIEIYVIPSVSMEDTILPGDKILMSKLSYGPRLPSSPFEIPWVNIAFYINKKYRTKADSVWWKYKRLHGFSEIKHNSVVVFTSPKNPDDVLIKRCMALPGDTLLITDEKVSANHRDLPVEGTIKLISRIVFNNYALASSLFDSLGLEEYHSKSGLKNYFSAPFNNNQKQVLLNFKCIDSIVLETNRPDSAYKTFPYNYLFPWSVDNFGPLVIPARGMKIQLNEKNYLLYNKVINRYEKNRIEHSESKYFLNGIPAESYTFNNNYYFMLGDNRHDSNDSRYWGFVPEEFIIGKAVMILFSNGNEGMRWGRTFRILR